MELVGSWWRRYGRGVAAALVGLAGLALLAFGPAGVAVGARGYTEQRAAAAGGAHYPGTEVRDGPAAFTVHLVRCGPAGPDADYGQVCEVTVGVRNDGTEELTIPGGAQKLHGSAGARHAPLSGDPEPFGALAPGRAATATIRFDLPRQSTVTGVEVHATAYTRGQLVVFPGGPLPLPPAD